MNAINLLPWRLKLHRQRSRILIWKLLFTFSLIILFSVTLHNNNEGISAEIIRIRQSILPLHKELARLQQQTDKLRKTYKVQENRYIIKRLEIERLLNLLTSLPLQQGELSALRLTDGNLQLDGIAETQAEFERLNRFLAENGSFTRIDLSQFVPQSDGSLQFQFTLMLENKNDHEPIQ